MSDATGNKQDVGLEKARQLHEPEDHLEDEEKILAGRHDVNYPALLTKDVPGG
ncbi:MAG TPA: hypothetical protein VHU42_03110 [Rhodopila sp.]|jgi:hypothetical protein|nr:hypothetical protein [Rhodopila sp.]